MKQPSPNGLAPATKHAKVQFYNFTFAAVARRRYGTKFQKQDTNKKIRSYQNAIDNGR